MSINRVVDVWDEKGYMMESCLSFEECYERAEKLMDALYGVLRFKGELTIKTKELEEMRDILAGLARYGSDGINDKSECIRRLKMHEVKNENT